MQSPIPYHRPSLQLLRRHAPLTVVHDHLVYYPTPVNLNYAWGFGSLAGLCLVIQIITGIFLAMHYTPHVDFAFESVEHIMRDVHNGWLIRYIHSNGASIFFLVVYLHIARGLYYGSYCEPRQELWYSGVVIFLLLIITAFLGYVLPWGQMSFWGATVITNLVTAIPFIGYDIAYFLWGGYSVANPTLNRFFALHYLLPFLIVGLVLVHLVLLHEYGSTNPHGMFDAVEYVPFYPYFYVKDLLGFLCLLTGFAYFVFFAPNALGHPDNYRPADPLVTPTHIVPEWYLLPFYAILRSIADKLLGVIAMASAILILLILPAFHVAEIATARFRPLFRHCFWFFILDVLVLGWIGGSPVIEPYLTIGQYATIFYFLFFLFLVPFTGFLETEAYENIMMTWWQMEPELPAETEYFSDDGYDTDPQHFAIEIDRDGILHRYPLRRDPVDRDFLQWAYSAKNPSSVVWSTFAPPSDPLAK